MAISGRLVIAVALGIVPVVVFNDPAVLLWWLGFLLLLCVVDLVIAGARHTAPPSSPDGVRGTGASQS